MEAGEVLRAELEFLFDCEGGAGGACMAVQVVEKWKGVWQRATFWGVGRGGGGSEWGEGGEGVGGVRGEVRAARGAGVGDSGRGAGEGRRISVRARNRGMGGTNAKREGRG